MVRDLLEQISSKPLLAVSSFRDFLIRFLDARKTLDGWLHIHSFVCFTTTRAGRRRLNCLAFCLGVGVADTRAGCAWALPRSVVFVSVLYHGFAFSSFPISPPRYARSHSRRAVRRPSPTPSKALPRLSLNWRLLFLQKPRVSSRLWARGGLLYSSLITQNPTLTISYSPRETPL